MKTYPAAAQCPLQTEPSDHHQRRTSCRYSREGAKLLKRERGDQLDALLQRNDLKLPVIYDEYNDTEIQLSKEELQLIQRIRQGRFPHVEVRQPG